MFNVLNKIRGDQNKDQVDNDLLVKIVGLRDFRRLKIACEGIFSDAMPRNQYKGCKGYPWDEVRKIRECLQSRNESCGLKEALEDWKAANPDEAEEILASRKAWEAERDRKFRVLYGIAKRHDLYIQWFGHGSVCCPDQFEVYRNCEPIARICLL